MNLDDCIHLVKEREKVRVAKEAGKPWPWTKDEIISSYRFCNVRREDDRVTVWIRENIRERFAGHPHLWFMLCIARQINWPDSLGRLTTDLTGERLYPGAWPDQDGFRPAALGKALQEMADDGLKVFTGAYSITAPPIKGMKKPKWVAEHTLGALWADRKRIGALWAGRQASLKHVHSEIMKYDCWGPFMAYQAVVDMRFTPLLSGARDVNDWAAAGPGTLRGLNRIAGRDLDRKVSQDQAGVEMRRLAPIIRKETGVDFDFSDVPNIMCETDKYMRVKNGEGKPSGVLHAGEGIVRLSSAEVGDLFNRLKHGDKDHQDWLFAALKAWSADKSMPPYVGAAPKAIPMILTCPSCGERHVDKGEFATKLHHTHACQGCGMVWRPAVVHTVGVQFLPGYKDES